MNVEGKTVIIWEVTLCFLKQTSIELEFDRACLTDFCRPFPQKNIKIAKSQKWQSDINSIVEGH